MPRALRGLYAQLISRLFKQGLKTLVVYYQLAFPAR